MRLIDIFRIAVRMLRTNLLRSVLTILGIGLAISFIVALIGLGRGLQNTTIGTIIASKSLLSLDVESAEGGPILNEAVIEEIKNLPGIESISPVINMDGKVKLKQHLATTAVVAAYQNYFAMEGIIVTQGESFADDRKEVVISSKLLELLDTGIETALGKQIELTYTDPNNVNLYKKINNLTIVGVTAADNATSIYLPYALITQDGPVIFSSIKAAADSRTRVLSNRDIIQKKGFDVNSLVETLDSVKQFFDFVTIGLAIFGLIALTVASIGMFNTLTIALIQRTREIGIMKAVGVNNLTVKKLFLAEASIIGLFGGLVGVGLGVTLNAGVELIFNQVAGYYEGNSVDLFQYPDGFLVGMVIFPVILAILTGFYPAIRAAKINPLNALRYE